MNHAAPDLICIGAAHWDIIGRADVAVPQGADVPGRVLRRPGGVALNVAIALARSGFRPALLTALGTDSEGDALAEAATTRGVDMRAAFRGPTGQTGAYVAIEDGSGLVAAVADAGLLEAAGDRILAPLDNGVLAGVRAGMVVILDGNLTAAQIASVAAHPALLAADLRIVPASPEKAGRLRGLLGRSNTTFHANKAEAEAIVGQVFMTAAEAAQALVGLGATRAIITDGAGVTADCTGDGIVTALPPPVRVANVTGAGDVFLAAHVGAERNGATRVTALEAALEAAASHVSGEDAG